MNNNRPILLIEDDSVDAMTVKRALKEIKVANPVVTTGNGEDALEYLHNDSNEKPCIILLDLNMPKMNGIEFLEIAKQDAKLKNIPVIVLTTSRDEQDKCHTFDMSVAGYMIKPVDYLKFVDTMKTIKIYWTLSELPN